MTRPIALRIAASLGLAFLVIAPGAALAQTEIKVLVNGRPITTYDINQRMALQRVGGETASSRTAEEQLVNEAVQLSEAERLGVEVAEGQITSAFNGIASQVQMTPANFTTALRGAGVNPATLRARLEAQIAWASLLQRRIQTNAPVRNQDVTAALLGEGGAAAPAQTMKELTLQAIIFVVPTGSGNDRFAARRREAESFRARFPGCEQSYTAARSIRDVVVRDIGRRDESQLGGPQGEELLRTAAGHAIRPQQTAQGIELVAVCSVRQVQSDAAARANVENRLLRAQGDTVADAYIAELKERAVIIRR